MIMLNLFGRLAQNSDQFRSASRPVWLPQISRGLAGVAGALLVSLPLAAEAKPNGTWLSRPQIWFHSSNQTLDAVMERIKTEQYNYVFLDYRNVEPEMRQQVAAAAREQALEPIVWIQSPQYRSMSVDDMIKEAEHADGLQVDDHFFTHYSQRDFQKLRARYDKKILCSIQPFQVNKIPPSGCDQLDVQCYTPASFQRCLGLANRLNAVLSLSSTSTIRHQKSLWGRSHNTFLWPHTNDYADIPVTASTPLAPAARSVRSADAADSVDTPASETGASGTAASTLPQESVAQGVD